jgi:hypothetical protein
MGSTSSSYESAPYSVITKDGQFEIRDYPKMSIVETRDGGFRTLFNYIQGSNVK